MKLLLEGYLEGDFCIGNGKKTSPETLELAPFIRYITGLGIFLTQKGTPMADSTLRKMAEKIWREFEKVRHNTKHNTNPHNQKGRN